MCVAADGSASRSYALAKVERSAAPVCAGPRLLSASRRDWFPTCRSESAVGTRRLGGRVPRSSCGRRPRFRPATVPVGYLNRLPVPVQCPHQSLGTALPHLAQASPIVRAKRLGQLRPDPLLLLDVLEDEIAHAKRSVAPADCPLQPCCRSLLRCEFGPRCSSPLLFWRQFPLSPLIASFSAGLRSGSLPHRGGVRRSWCRAGCRRYPPSRSVLRLGGCPLFSIPLSCSHTVPGRIRRPSTAVYRPRPRPTVSSLSAALRLPCLLAPLVEGRAQHPLALCSSARGRGRCDQAPTTAG